MKYKVAFYRGEELTIRTRVEKGQAWLDDNGMHVDGPNSQMFVRKTDLRSAEIFRLHGTASVILVEYQGGRIFLSVIRFLIGGQFMLVNFYKTCELQKRIAALAGQH